MVVNLKMLVNNPSNKIIPKSSSTVGIKPEHKTGQSRAKSAQGAKMGPLSKMLLT